MKRIILLRRSIKQRNRVFFVELLKRLTLLILPLYFLGCTLYPGPEPIPLAIGKRNTSVSVWMTKADQSKLLTNKPDIQFISVQNSGNSDYTFYVDEDITYQKMNGFGGSLTESSAYLLSMLNHEDRTSLLDRLFNPGNDGPALTMLRQPVGSPDFALSLYSYDDNHACILAKANNKYVFVDTENTYGNGLNSLVAISDSAGEGEAFDIQWNSDNTYSFRSCKNGKFVMVDDFEQLKAESDSTGDNEKFRLVCNNAGDYAYQSAWNNKFICADGQMNNDYPLYANRTTVSGWESFIVAGIPDPDLAYFSIERDTHYIIPVLQQVLSINPDIKIIASPWSPPAWMREKQQMVKGGPLIPEYREVYARYFVKFIQAYREEGIRIWAITPQNEPLAENELSGPGMVMSAEEQIDFIKNYLEPAFLANNIKTKIICYDHNYDQPGYPLTVLASMRTSSYVIGSAWHNYKGKPAAMKGVHSMFPDRGIWFTEGGYGTWVGNGSWKANFKESMKNAIRITTNWAKSIIWWNIVLNQDGGPMTYEGNTANRGMVTVNESNHLLTFEANYYSIAHFSRFVRPGAFRIACNSFPNKMEGVAFINRGNDKRIVFVVFNRTSVKKTIKVVWGRNAFVYKVPAAAAVTFMWQGNN